MATKGRGEAPASPPEAPAKSKAKPARDEHARSSDSRPLATQQQGQDHLGLFREAVKATIAKGERSAREDDRRGQFRLNINSVLDRETGRVRDGIPDSATLYRVQHKLVEVIAQEFERVVGRDVRCTLLPGLELFGIWWDATDEHGPNLAVVEEHAKGLGLEIFMGWSGYDQNVYGAGQELTGLSISIAPLVDNKEVLKYIYGVMTTAESTLVAAAKYLGLSLKDLKQAAKNFKTAKKLTVRKGARQEFTPNQVSAVIEDSTLGRLQQRYERLRRIALPKDGFKDDEQRRKTQQLVAAYSLLKKRCEKVGLEPPPEDARVTEARRLLRSYYRRRKAAISARAPH